MENKNTQTGTRKFNWKERKKFTTYEEANNLRNALIEEGVAHVKVRRCGPEGTRFKVTVGTPVKTNKKDNNKKSNKKENNNAN